MAFKPGQSGNPAGKAKGTVSKVTRTVREAFEAAFNGLQDDPDHPAHLRNWSRKNPDKFYLLAQKLIPTQVAATVEDVSKELDPTARAARLAALTARLEARATGNADDVEDLA